MSRHILIVEDEETLRESIKRIFVKEGYTVDGAESAEQGLSLLETGVYDVILTDIILPGMDGIEMLTRVREQIPDQIIIIVTAYASLDTSIKALRAGAYDYIMKPVIHEEIKQVVRNALRQKSLQSETLLETGLFGHVRGAFTGAVSAKKGILSSCLLMICSKKQFTLSPMLLTFAGKHVTKHNLTVFSG